MTSSAQLYTSASDSDIDETIAALAASSALAAAEYSAEFYMKEALHDSSFTGFEWIMELLGHNNIHRMAEQLGMRKPTFERLVEVLWGAGLRHTRNVTVQEQVAIFLFIATTALPTRKIAERFQRSGDTISRMFHRVLDAVLSEGFYSKYVQLPDSNTPLSSVIEKDPRFFPFFKDCIGAIDGTHVSVTAPAEDRAKYRDRKGVVSQNILVACTFEMRVCYVLSGWEGSASDGTVFEDARAHGLSIPPGKFYLADAGFALSDATLVPYRGVRYHLREWEASNARPTDHRELFNLRHSSARMVIERTFGVIKRRFKLFRERTEYPLETQARIIPALCAIHNFILTYDAEDGLSPDNGDIAEGATINEVWAGGVSNAERERATETRDKIATEMWKNYSTSLSSVAP